MSIINNYLYGWQELEPTLLACIALNQNMLLIGKHGVGKSAFMKFVANAIANGQKEKFNAIKYSMDKENLISMVGIPNIEALKKGRIEYATHQRSIFNADVAMFDEITRASKENQNMVLEIFEEGSVFGIPLDRLKLRIATANDETYKGAMKLDAALLDRFYVVLPIPDAGTTESVFGPEEFEEIIWLNLGKREKNMAESDKILSSTIKKIKKANQDLWTQKDSKGEHSIRDNVIEFSAKYLSQVHMNMCELNKGKKSDKFYISLRQIGDHFPRLIMSLAAYYKEIRNDPDYLQSGALEAIKYSLSTKLQIKMETLNGIFANLKDLLTDGEAIVGKLKVSLTAGSVKSRVEMIIKHADIIKEHFEFDEIVNSIGTVIQDINVSSDGKPVHIEELIRLESCLRTTKLAEPCYWAAKMKIWRFGSDPRRGILQKVMSWQAA